MMMGSAPPSPDAFYDSYEDPTANEQVVEYSRFEQSLYGAPGNVRSSEVEAGEAVASR